MLQVKQHPSPNYNDRRGGAKPSMIILHYTDLVTPEEALDIMCDPVREVSAHYMITESGEVMQLVEEEKRAWHAGKSYWLGQEDINSHAIGIELCNSGHQNIYRPFPHVQIEVLMTLCKAIMQRWGIPADRVLAHSDIAPERKKDPGELFPWKMLLSEGIGLWPRDIPHTDDGIYALCLELGFDPQAPRDDVLTAFDRHFRPERICNTT